MVLKCDSAKTMERTSQLTSYMDSHVLGPTGFCCSSGDACMSSAKAQKQSIDFAAGQLSYLGRFYDIEEDSVPLRILVIGMETGRTDGAVTLPMRSGQILESAARWPKARNPHMIGVTHALQTLHGREITADAAGEFLNVEGSSDGVHIFDAYAMANVRLCTSVKAGTTTSRPTSTMTKNCIRHLRETIRILEPTVCVVQGMAISKALRPVMTSRVQVTPHLAEATIGDTHTLMTEFSHPTAWADQNWGRWSNMPYLQCVVIPTLTDVRARLGLRSQPGQALGVDL